MRHLTCIIYATIKYNTEGEQRWIKYYPNQFEPNFGIATDSSNNVYVTTSVLDPITWAGLCYNKIQYKWGRTMG